MKDNLKWPRILVLASAVILIGALFLPIWKIELTAPQYPEGLALIIYASKLGGNIDVINGLNHYIGMKTLDTKDFIEFSILPYIIGTFIILGLLAAYIHKKKLYYAFILSFIVFGIVAMADFYRWNYNYGHDLDPNAPIKVPGMAYQPPLIGYKQLLNFGAYSMPAAGGWMFIGAGVLLVATYLLILKPRWLPFQKKQIAFAFVIAISFCACSSGPQPMKYGHDACDHCKMIIMDKRFANQWVTEKNKIFRFDDIHCLVSFSKTNKSKGIAYINDYAGNLEFAKANDMYFVQSENLNSPMGGNISAFTNQTSMQKIAQANNARYLTWQEVQQVMTR